MKRRHWLVTLITCAIPATVVAQTSPLNIQPSTGRIGIGTSTPAYTLDVTGTVNASSFRGDGSQLTNVPGSNVWSAGPGAIWYTAGKVGIATPSPHEFLQINDSLTLRSFNAFSNVAHNVYMSNDYQHVHAGGASLAQLADNAIMFYIATPAAAHAYATFAERLRVDLAGVSVTGTLSASVKNFAIDHPLDPDGAVLVHSSLEGPEVAVYYRGEANLVDGEAVVALPAYFEALTRKDGRTVHLTPVGGWAPLFVVGDVSHGRFTVRTDGGHRAQRFYWEVKAVRADVEPLAVEPEGKVKRRGPRKAADDAGR